MKIEEIAERLREVADRLSDLEDRIAGAACLDEWARLAAQREYMCDELLWLQEELRQASK